MKTVPWPQDNTRALIEFYGDPRGSNGEPSANFQARNLLRVTIPWRAVAAWDKDAVVRTALVNKRCADAVSRVFAHIWQEVGQDQAHIEIMGMHLYGGAYNYRVKRGLSSLSVHAFGAALDFDPEHNGLGSKKGKMHPLVVDAFKSEGAVWGGNFKSRPDPMHFQFATI